MNRMMKRSFAMLVGGALLALSASAAAGDAVARSAPVKLSDADLDQITAGSGVLSLLVVFNPGKANVLKINPSLEMQRHATCINCMELDVPRTSGAVGVLLPSGEFIIKFVRQSPF